MRERARERKRERERDTDGPPRLFVRSRREAPAFALAFAGASRALKDEMTPKK